MMMTNFKKFIYLFYTPFFYFSSSSSSSSSSSYKYIYLIDCSIKNIRDDLAAATTFIEREK